jgi:hypothetical protein
MRQSSEELERVAPVRSMSMYILRGVQSGLRSASGGSSRAYVVGGSGVGTQADAIQAKGVRVGELSSIQVDTSLLRGMMPAACSQTTHDNVFSLVAKSMTAEAERGSRGL